VVGIDIAEADWYQYAVANQGANQMLAKYSVQTSRLADLTKKIEKISRRCVKLGLPAVTLTVVGEEDRAIRGAVNGRATFLSPAEVEIRIKKNQPVTYMKYTNVEVTGQAPFVDGWTFMATLQHLDVDGETANLLKTVPGYEGKLPDKFRTADPSNCDQCHNVRYRKDTYVVHNEQTGEWKQVGRNCLADFLGGKDPHDVCKAMEYLTSIDGMMEDGEGGGGFGHGDLSYSMKAFLIGVAAMIRIDGWVSRSKARIDERLTATADDARALMFPTQEELQDPKFRKWHDARTVTEKDIEIAEKALTYAQEELPEVKDGNDYLFNLWVACNQANIGRRVMGIAASLVPHYLREVERQILREKEAKDGENSKHFGQVGERLNFYATVLRVSTREGDYGTTFIYKMLTREGNMVTWFSSGSADMEIGKEYLLTGTIKKLDTYNNVAQTIVTRCNVYHNEARAEMEAKIAKKAAREAKKAAKMLDASHAAT
jgi:hypothetical protein